MTRTNRETRSHSLTLTVLAVLLAMLALVAAITGCSDSGADDQSIAATTLTSTSEESSPTDSTTATTEPAPGKTRADYEAELPGLLEAVEADPTDLYSLERLAIVHYQLDNYEEAAAAYQKLLAIVDDAFTHNNLGNVYRDWGKSDEAKAQYEQAIALDPTLKQPYINLALLYKAEGDIEAAREVLARGSEAITDTADEAALDKAGEQLTTTTTG